MKGLELLTLQTLNSSFVVHPTLIYDDQNVILIDSGNPGTYEVLIKELKNNGFTLSDLTHIIITHHDIDHVGNLYLIIKDYPNIKVLANYIEEPYLTGTKEYIAHLDSSEGKEIKETLENYTIDKVTALHDNELLPYCGGIKVIHTPGHTSGHICLYLERYKTLVAGDELNVINEELMGPNQQFTLNMDQAIESLSKFKKYDIESVFCFHGGEYSNNPNARIIQIATSE